MSYLVSNAVFILGFFALALLLGERQQATAGVMSAPDLPGAAPTAALRLMHVLKLLCLHNTMHQMTGLQGQDFTSQQCKVRISMATVRLL